MSLDVYLAVGVLMAGGKGLTYLPKYLTFAKIIALVKIGLKKEKNPSQPLANLVAEKSHLKRKKMFRKLIIRQRAKIHGLDLCKFMNWITFGKK